MCGIFGILDPQGAAATRENLLAMGQAIMHRGPDDSGLHLEPGLGLGMNRLAIIDLDTGQQPMYSADRNFVIVYNGELYNHRELRRELEQVGCRFRTESDTEVVLQAFATHGPDCLQRFNGMFAFAVWDSAQRRLFLARDRYGIKPLYYAYRDGFAFASESKALLPVMGCGADWTALARYFVFGYVPTPDSPFAGIRKLPAGHYAWADAEGVRLRRYWEPTYGLGPEIPVAEAEAEVRRLLARAVDLELMSDVPVGVFLSGGLDSSAVASYAHDLKAGLHFFSLSFEEKTHDESADAALMAQHLGVTCETLRFTRPLMEQSLEDVATYLDEPFGDATLLPLLALSRFARRQVKVVLTGWGGDEIFAGYPTYLAHRLAAAYRRLPGFLSRGLIPWACGLLPVSDRYMSLEFKARRFISGMGLPPELQHFVWMGYFSLGELPLLLTPDCLAQVAEEPLAPVVHLAEELSERELVGRIMHLDGRFFLEGNGLFQADRMTMAAGLEGRVPLLNNDLVDFVNALPSRLKMVGGRPKELLRRSLANRLPRAILQKPKKGFGPPSSVWSKGVLAGVFDSLLAPARLERQGVLNVGYVGRLLGEHRAAKADHGRKLWALLSFQLWYDRYIESRGV